MIKRVHRWLGLLAAVFWLTQAVTGVLIVFRWELDDATLAGPPTRVDTAALGARIERLRAEGSAVSSMWASGGRADRFDIFHSRAGRDVTTRVDGAGGVLRERRGDTLTDGGVWDTLTRVHQTLLAGDLGRWIVGLSGALLLSNLALGLRLAWPRRGMATFALLRLPRGAAPARAYGWHRLLGLWFGLPAMALVAAGLLLVFHGELERALGAAHAPAPTPASTSNADIGPGEAVRLALARHPGARLSGVSLPEPDAPRYRIRLNVPDETPRLYGATTVMLAAADGAVLLDHDARHPGWRRWIVDTLYPFHTGQAFGAAGRAVTLAVGLWLATMIALGLWLWWVRRPRGGAGPRA